MDSEVICNPKKALTYLLTYSVNNIGLRDASASKNPTKWLWAMPGFWTQKYMFKRFQDISNCIELETQVQETFPKGVLAKLQIGNCGAKFCHGLDSGKVILAQSRQKQQRI